MKETPQITIGSFIAIVGILFMLCPLVALIIAAVGVILCLCCITFPLGLVVLAVAAELGLLIPPAIAFGIGIPLVILGIIIECMKASKDLKG